MMIPAWVWFAILTMAAQSAMALVNEHFKVRALHMLWWMRLAAVVALLPFVPFYTMPSDPIYYVYVIAGAVIFCWFDLVYFGMTAKSGAGVVTRIGPLVVAGTFVLWTAITPSLAVQYIETPLRTLGIVAALAGSVFFALRLKQCAISWSTLKTMAPYMALACVGMVLGKLAMQRAAPPEGVFYYTLIQSAVVWALYALMTIAPASWKFIPHLDLNSSFREKRVVLAGLCAAAGWLVATPSKWYAISIVENPAYVSTVSLCEPFMILLIYRLLRRREEARIADGIGIVACAIVLVVFTQF
jgi:hypothetical protein